ncbi:hypothetical protein IV102_31595 [bacterium]|nr:hypothetical protein [bacterium]
MASHQALTLLVTRHSADLAHMEQELEKIDVNLADALVELAGQMVAQFNLPAARLLLSRAFQLGPDQQRVKCLLDVLDTVLALDRERESLPPGQILARRLVSLEGRNQMDAFQAPRTARPWPDLTDAAEGHQCSIQLRHHCPTFCRLRPQVLEQLELPEPTMEAAGEWFPDPLVTTHDGQSLPPEWRFLVAPPPQIGKVSSVRASFSGSLGLAAGGLALLVSLAGICLAVWTAQRLGAVWPWPWEYVALVVAAGALPGWFAWSWARHVSHEVTYVGQKGVSMVRCWGSLRRVRRFTLFFAEAARVEQLQTPPVCLWWSDYRGFRQGSRPIYRLSVEEDPALARAAIDAFKKFKIQGHI